MPEAPFQFDQASNHLLVTLNAVDLQVLATDQHGDIRCQFAGDGQLVHDLQLHILRHALFPEARAVYAACFALKESYVICTDHLTVNVGQHPRQVWIWVLQYGVDSTHTFTGAFAVVRCHDGFEDIAPVRRALLILRVDLG